MVGGTHSLLLVRGREYLRVLTEKARAGEFSGADADGGAQGQRRDRMSTGTVSNALRYDRGRDLRLDFPRSVVLGLLRSSRRRPIGEKRQEGRIDVEVFPASLHLLEHALLGEGTQ